MTPRRPDIKESDIVQYLQLNLGGQTEVPTKLGRIDLLVGNTIIECKKFEQWKELLGQLLINQRCLPDKRFVGVTYHFREPDNLSDVLSIFESYNIQLIVLIGDAKLRGISRSLISAKRRSALALFKVPDREIRNRGVDSLRTEQRSADSTLSL